MKNNQFYKLEYYNKGINALCVYNLKLLNNVTCKAVFEIVD